jgi:putative peptide zinc metalloprotease protein
MSSTYRPVAGWAARPFDSAAREASWLVESPGGQRWHVNQATLQLLRALDAAPTLEDAARELAGTWGRPVEAPGLAEYLDRVLVPKGMIRAEGAAAAAAPRAPAGRMAYLSYRRTLVPARVLDRASWALRPLFGPVVFPLAFAAALLAAGAYLWTMLPGVPSLPLAMSAGGAIAAFVASTFVHELGHAAAARRYGARHGALGFGLYLVFPVLYMELDDAWKLPRGRRAVVDLGGLYLQLLFGLALVALGRVWAPAAAVAPGAMLLIAMALLTNLNPLFRFDGYWLASDLLGLPNLRQKAWQMLRRPRSAAALMPGGVSRATAVALAVYAVASNVFFAAFFARLALQLPGFVLHAYPALAVAELHRMAAALQPFRPGQVALAALALVGPTAVLMGLALMIAFRARSLFGWLRRRRSATRAGHAPPLTGTATP